jgi:hypothetical protein
MIVCDLFYYLGLMPFYFLENRIDEVDFCGFTDLISKEKLGKLGLALCKKSNCRKVGLYE